MTIFIALGILCSFAAVALVALPLLRHQEKPAPVAALGAALLVPTATALIYLVSSNYDWRDPPRAASAQAQTTNPQLEAAIGELEKRVRSNPQDADAWMMLGSSFMQSQQSTAAERAYREALELSDGQNQMAKLGIAEAQILADRSRMRGSAGDLVEEVLAVEPNNTKALFYGGLVAGARDNLPLLQTRWQQLLAASPPEPVRRIVTQELQAMGLTVDSSSESSAADKSIEVNVRLADELQTKVGQGAALFLFARDGAAAAGPPVAALRTGVAALPATLQLSDNNVMIPGRSLADLEEIRLVARISQDGEALAQAGDLVGEANWTWDGGPVEILIDQVVKN